MHGTLTGSVKKVEASFFGMFPDAVSSLNGAGTLQGHSGLPCESSKAMALGIHTLGTAEPPGIGSEYSVTMFAKVAPIFLQVNLLELTWFANLDWRQLMAHSGGDQNSNQLPQAIIRRMQWCSTKNQRKRSPDFRAKVTLEVIRQEIKLTVLLTN